MNELNAHYGLLLGLSDSWEVVEVNVDPEGRLVEIQLRHRGGKLVCPDCQQACPQADLAAERTWRHLDLMQFETRIRARVPRCDCEQCGVKTTAVPWAGKHSRFTLLFEAFAIKVLTACSSVKRAAELLKFDWDTVHSIMSRAVERYGTEIFAWCLMPNHWHLVVKPHEDGELSRFVGWLSLTHTQRWHAHYHNSGSGHLYQGRFKSFPVQEEEHFLTVCRYVERNPLRANLVSRAEQWRWSSLWRWHEGTAAQKRLLAA